MDTQDALFGGSFDAVPDEIGYRGPVACSAAGITYRQLDYWARTGLVVPGIRDAEGSGTQRLYSFRDILMLRVIKRLLDAGVALAQIRLAMDYLRQRGTTDLTQITLLSDGTSVFEATEDREIIDLLKGGQAMFSVTMSGVWRDIEGTLSHLPSQRVDEVWTDELSERRRLRRVG